MNAAKNGDVSALNWLKNFNGKSKYMKFLVLCALGQLYLENENTVEAKQYLNAALNEFSNLYHSELSHQVPSKAKKIANDSIFCALFLKVGTNIKSVADKISEKH